MVAITGTLLLPSCKNKQEEDKNGLIGLKSPKDKEVPYGLAMKCVDEYEKTPLGSIKKKTQGVIFKKDLLEQWLKHLNTITTYDKMDIRFGIYTKQVLNDTRDPHPDKVDKITIFLFPILNDGSPAKKSNSLRDENVDPFNMGEVYP